MADEKKELKDEELEQIAGGSFTIRIIKDNNPKQNSLKINAGERVSAGDLILDDTP